MTDDKNIEYSSSERRNAIRVVPKGHKLSFTHNTVTTLECIDISMDGVALMSDLDLAIDNNDQVAFILDQNDVVIGKVNARLVYKQPSRSGWQFTAMEEEVREFIDQLVLETQKKALRKAAHERIVKNEKKLLDLADDEYDM